MKMVEPIKANMSTTKNMEKASTAGQTVRCMMETGSMVNSMELALIPILKDKLDLDSGKMVNVSNGLQNKMTEHKFRLKITK